jgi:hypothetical protein
MKILSEKESICRTIKVLYSNDENYFDDIKERKKEGWHPITKPDYYNERKELMIKCASNGTVITYIKYEKLP